MMIVKLSVQNTYYYRGYSVESARVPFWFLGSIFRTRLIDQYVNDGLEDKRLPGIYDEIINMYERTT